MLTQCAILASLTVHAISALASPVDSLIVQDSTSFLVSDRTCSDAEWAEQQASHPEVLLDDAVFTGIQKGATYQFLGIPFAYPP